MLLAYFRARLAHIGAESADLFRKRRYPAHPLRGQGADIRTFPAQPGATGHQLHVMAAAMHADHVVAARVADPGASPTGGDAILILTIELSIVLVHKNSFVPENIHAEKRRIMPAKP